MKCPNCDETLVMSERQGVEIDYCPKCRGVWLDRGELDKIIEKSATEQAHPSTYNPPPQFNQPSFKDPRNQGWYDPYYKKKKKGFLGDLFDFD